MQVVVIFSMPAVTSLPYCLTFSTVFTGMLSGHLHSVLEQCASGGGSIRAAKLDARVSSRHVARAILLRISHIDCVILSTGTKQFPETRVEMSTSYDQS